MKFESLIGFLLGGWTVQTTYLVCRLLRVTIEYGNELKSMAAITLIYGLFIVLAVLMEKYKGRMERLLK